MISVKGVATIAGIAAFGAVSAIVLAPAASADGQYAAIAYSPSTAIAGASRNKATREEATNVALQSCASFDSHPPDCKVVASIGPSEQCIALAAGPETIYYSGGSGATLEEAKAPGDVALSWRDLHGLLSWHCSR
jgi:Domain of unknown function (DUF4189)